MPKSALLASINARPAVHNGELVTAATVVQVSQLAMTAPYSGDFQIIDNGRLIVGEHPDLGDRVVVGKFGLFGYDPDGVNTFAVLSKQYGPWGSGDVFAGYVSGNYLHFDQSAGTLGVYSPAGAGFIAGADGSLYAGDTDGAHMRWNTASRAIEVRNGEDIKISLDANGDAMFDGTVYASGGRIYGTMQVDGLFRAGDVDGPSVSLGRFERDDGLGNTVESAEIIATDDNNMPWFHVTAGGSTAGGGWFHLGGTGDYPQRLTYDGQDLVFDGTLYARGGEFTGDVTVTDGSIWFGGGRGVLDINGMRLQSDPSGNAGYNALTWVRDLSAVPELEVMTAYAGHDLGQSALYLTNSNTYSDVTVSSIYINPRTDGVATSANVFINPTAVNGGNSLVSITADTITLAGAVTLGDGGSTNYSQIDGDGILSFAGVARIQPRLGNDTKTSDFTASTQTYYRVNTTSGAVTATLPTAVGISGRVYVFKLINGSNTFTIDPDGGETIDGASTWSTTTLYAKVTIISNNTNWEIIA